MSKQRASFVAVGFLGGIAAGTLIWSRMQRQYRRNLFSPHTFRRVAALGYLRSRSEDVETPRGCAVIGGR
jgi:hypothetical protein